MQNLIQANREIIEEIKLTVKSIREQNYFEGNLHAKRLFKKFSGVFDILVANKEVLNELELLFDEEEWIEIISETLAVQEQEDYVLLADLLEINWLARLVKLQTSLIMRITEGTGVVADCEYEGQKYFVEYTSVGSYTLRIEQEDKSFYLHSNHDPFEEALNFAKEYADTEIDTYVVYGFGLGYHIQALARMCPEAKIVVYERSEAVLEFANEYGAIDTSLPLYKNLEIILDPEYEQVRERIKSITAGTVLLVHYPSLKNIDDDMVRRKIEEYFVSISSIKNQRKYLDANFRKNIARGDDNVDTLLPEFENKSVVMVARGPSLADDIEGIKRIRDEVIIVAVYSVAEYLIENGITPDYMVVSDAQTCINYEVKNEALHDIPLIYVSTAASNVVESHKGTHYIMLQEGYNYAEDVAATDNHMLFSTGGSVATVIIDMCIRFLCSKLTCVGLDLAFTGDTSHVEGTRGRDVKNEEHERMVQDVRGNLIATQKNLDIYRRWIERRIEGISSIEFINASGGAYIHGMKHERIGRLGNILVYYGVSAYNSTTTFAKKMITRWNELGYNVVELDINSEGVTRRLQNVIGNEFEFAFSMNGVTANVKLNDDTYLQDNIKAPFISMYVDHPLYNLVRLDTDLNNYHGLFVDENIVDYIKRYFKNISTARMLPHGGDGLSEDKLVSYADRKIDVLFTGSYKDPEKILEEIGGLHRMSQVIIMNIVEQMISDNTVTVDMALENFIKKNDIPLTDSEFKKYMDLTVHADEYVRALYRKLVILALVKNGVKVNVFGSGWNKFDNSNPANLKIGGSVDADTCKELMANSKIVLNVMPWFKKGSHERVFDAMLSKAVCVSDESEYLSGEFVDGENIVIYSLKDLAGFVNKVKDLLADDEKAERIANNGYEIAKDKHTWANRADEIIKIANEINGKADDIECTSHMEDNA